MLPSPRVVALLALAAGMFVLGGLYPPLAAMGVLYLLLLAATLGVSLLMTPGRRHVRIERRIPQRISVGRPTRIDLRIENRSRQRVDIRLAEDLPEGVEADPAELQLRLAPGQEADLHYRLICRRRGRQHLPGLDVRVRPAGGLWIRQFRHNDPAELRVYPNLADLSRYELQLRRGLLLRQGVARLRQIGQGTEFESLRGYESGDDTARVDWKATAKRRQLIVRNHQPEREQSVLLALDVGRATAGEFGGLSRLDRLINAALMLAHVTLRQGDWFSLLVFSDRIEKYIPPIRRLGRIEQIVSALYPLSPRLVESDYGLACRFVAQHNRKRSLICLMTDVVDRGASEDIIAYLANFARRHLPLAVTLTNPDLRATAEAPLSEPDTDPYVKAAALQTLHRRAEALAVMRRRGVDVLDVHPRHLTPELINRYLLIKSRQRL